MHNIERYISEKWAHVKSNKIYVACSGGLDSIVLVSVLNKLKFNISVVHVNYQLRGEDSDLDAQFVETFCKKHDQNHV